MARAAILNRMSEQERHPQEWNVALGGDLVYPRRQVELEDVIVRLEARLGDVHAAFSATDGEPVRWHATLTLTAASAAWASMLGRRRVEAEAESIGIDLLVHTSSAQAEQSFAACLAQLGLIGG